LKLKAVSDLGKHLISEGFKKSSDLEWFRHKEIAEYGCVEDFLASITTCDRDAIFQQINDNFWSMVEDTFEMVSKANEEIGRAC